MWRSHVSGVIVVIVALAVLVVLGGLRGFLGGPPPRAKQTAGVRGILANARGAHSPSAITRITFGVMDIERRLSHTYPMLIPCLSLYQIPMKFR